MTDTVTTIRAEDDLRRRRAAPVLRLALAAAIALASANVLGIGADAAWTETETGGISIVAGRLDIALGPDGTNLGTLDVAATDIAPGDVVARTFTVANLGSIDLGSLRLTTSSADGTALWSGADRLQLKLGVCAQQWAETAVDDGYAYSCTSGATWVVGSATTHAELQRTDLDVSGSFASVTGGATDHVMVELLLPTSAGDEYMGLSDTIRFSFAATQRDGIRK